VALAELEDAWLGDLDSGAQSLPGGNSHCIEAS